MAFDFAIVSDGGCIRKPGRTPRAYGSYQITGNRGEPVVGRLEFGDRTSNEAEYLSMIAGLERLISMLEDNGLDPKDASVLLITDSQLVHGQVCRGWKVNAQHLRPLVKKEIDLKGRFGRSFIDRTGRENIVPILGH